MGPNRKTQRDHSSPVYNAADHRFLLQNRQHMNNLAVHPLLSLSCSVLIYQVSSGVFCAQMRWCALGLHFFFSQVQLSGVQHTPIQKITAQPYVKPQYGQSQRISASDIETKWPPSATVCHRSSSWPVARGACVRTSGRLGAPPSDPTSDQFMNNGTERCISGATKSRGYDAISSSR